jgi:hypothetical protein
MKRYRFAQRLGAEKPTYILEANNELEALEELKEYYEKEIIITDFDIKEIPTNEEIIDIISSVAWSENCQESDFSINQQQEIMQLVSPNHSIETIINKLFEMY